PGGRQLRLLAMTGAASRGVAGPEPETIERRGERARLASWRADGEVAHLSPAAMRPLSADFVGSCLDALRARGFTFVVTSALSEAESAGFLRAGFDVQEELELLTHDLNAIPDVGHRLRRPRRQERARVLVADGPGPLPGLRLPGPPRRPPGTGAGPVRRRRLLLGLVVALSFGVGPVAGRAEAPPGSAAGPAAASPPAAAAPAPKPHVLTLAGQS